MARKQRVVHKSKGSRIFKDISTILRAHLILECQYREGEHQNEAQSNNKPPGAGQTFGSMHRQPLNET